MVFTMLYLSRNFDVPPVFVIFLAAYISVICFDMKSSFLTCGVKFRTAGFYIFERRLFNGTRKTY